MPSPASEFIVPLPPVVKIEVEEQVIPKDFRGYLSRALTWTALMPLFMLAAMHFFQLVQTTKSLDADQISMTNQYARSLEARFVSTETFLETTAETIAAASEGGERIPEEKLSGLLERMPYLSFLLLTDAAGKELFYIGKEGAVKSKRAATLFKDTDTEKIKALDGFVCFATDSAALKGESRLIGCEPKSDFEGIFSRITGQRKMDMVLFDRYNRQVLFTSGDDSEGASSLSSLWDLPGTAREKLSQGIFLWRTNQKRNSALVMSAARVPEKDWIVAFAQPVALQDQQLMSSLLTSGAFLICGTLLALIVGIFLGRRLTHHVQTLTDQIAAFKEKGIIVKPEASFAEGAPKELQLLSRRFAELGKEIQSAQKKLEEANADLTHQVALRTASLNQRNRELNALQLLLRPLEEPAIVVISRTIESFKKNLGLLSLRLLTEDPPKPEAKEELLEIPGRHHKLGFLAYRLPQGDQKERLLASLQRLADSIGIVLDNRDMFSSVKVSRSRFNSLLESMNEGVILIGRTGSLLYANKAARLLLGISVAQEISKVAGYLAGRFNKIPGVEALPGEDFSVPARFVCKKDSEFFIEISSFLVPEFDGYIGPRRGLLVRDVSQEVSVERMKRNLVSVVAHELKTPVTTMRLQTETLERQFRSGKTSGSEELMKEMLEESDRLQHLISDWLDIARLESGSMVIKPRIYPVALILRQAMKSVSIHCPSLAVKTFLAADAECIFADKDRLVQVFVNVLENASRYCRNKIPACFVSSEKKENSIEISFADNGIGIEEGHLDKIFDSFYQVDMSLSRRVGGTGLGLSICRGIISAHGGRMWAEHNRPEGTIFKISLPCA